MTEEGMIETENYEIYLELPGYEGFGWFNHKTLLGKENGGNMDFHNKKLIDCYAMSTVPLEVAEVLRKNGYMIDSKFLRNE